MQKGWLKKKSNKEEGIKAAFKEGLILMGFLGLGGGIKASLWTKLRVRTENPTPYHKK